MLDAFKIKPFDLEPVYAEWTNPPMFTGNPKKDPPVDEWLEQIRTGCVEHKVPEEYWHKVAQHYMTKKALARLEELKMVLAKINGGKYRWNWKKFKIAMHNMGWDIETTATQAVKVHAKQTSSGGWWLSRKDSQSQLTEEPASIDDTQRPTPSKTKSDTSILTWKGKMHPPPRSNTTDSLPTVKPPKPSRANTLDFSIKSLILSRSNTEDLTHMVAAPVVAAPTTITRSASKSHSVDDSVTTVTQAPIWLLNACNALEFLTSEHPKAMSAISAVLITAGTLPAIPAISAGAGGAVLASGAAQAVGAIAVSVGTWIKAAQEGKIKTDQSEGEVVVANAK